MHNVEEGLACALALLERSGERQQPRVVTVQAGEYWPEFLPRVKVRSVLCSSTVRHGDEGCVCGCWTKMPSAPRTARNPSLRRGTREAVCLPIDACRVVEVSTSTEMGSGYWEVTLAPRGLHPCFGPVIRLTLKIHAGRVEHRIRYSRRTERCMYVLGRTSA